MRRILLGSVTLMLLSGLPAQGQGKKPLASTGWGSLTGKVTLDGKVPEPADLTAIMKAKDAACCLGPKVKKIETVDPTWIVDPKTKAIANVAVWIKAPAGTYFPTHEKLKVRKDEILIDQPHCAFLPRISAFQPFYYDGAKEVPTGQTLVIRNSAECNHNVRATGGALNPGFNKNLIPGGQIQVKDFVPQTLPISINCDIHTWMSAKIFVFDHPYYAITKEDGTFTIPYVPAGAEVTVMAWHEGVGYGIMKKEGEKLIVGQKMTLKEGKNEFNITIAAPK